MGISGTESVESGCEVRLAAGAGVRGAMVRGDVPVTVDATPDDGRGGTSALGWEVDDTGGVVERVSQEVGRGVLQLLLLLV